MSPLNVRVVRFGLLFALVLALSITGSAASLNQGSTATTRSNQDSSPGEVYIYAGGAFPAGETLNNFTWFGPVLNGVTLYVTPILFSVNSGVYTVQGVGAGEELTGPFPAQTMSNVWGLQMGTNVTGANYTFGFLEGLIDRNTGNVTLTSAGGVEFNPTVDAPPGVDPSSTNDWVFTPSSDSITNIAPGTTFGANGTFALNSGSGAFNVDRTYSANANGALSGVAEPGTFSLITGAGLVLAGLFRYRYVRGRRD
jgi:hypothetical protein